jgi:hypothetical protein
MTNKINIRQESSEYRLTARGEWVKTIAKRALQATGVAAAGGVLALGIVEADKATQPRMTGEQTITVNTGDTVHGLINENVENGGSHVGDVTEVVRDNPDNADVFENGQLDPGEQLELPEKVTD